MKAVFNELETHPVIAAVRESAHVNAALDSPVRMIFLMGGSLSELEAITRKARRADKKIMIHIELVKGLGRDCEGVEYLAEVVRPDGMVSTKPQLIKEASKLGLATVLQIFLIDTQAYLTGLKNIASTKPDALEIMPGLMPRVINTLSTDFDIPVITAGLVKQPDEVKLMLAAGAAGIAISEQSLWSYSPE
ncbi:MAG: glycerol-3-phosphate responsive antiterminator [Desulfovibrio sp.]|nr:MAG: glycerol-3-phosphate responsive antiterminator [Desulfovibrio sp.]